MTTKAAMKVQRAAREAFAELLDSERRGEALHDVVALHLGVEELTAEQAAVVESEAKRWIALLHAKPTAANRGTP